MHGVCSSSVTRVPGVLRKGCSQHICWKVSENVSMSCPAHPRLMQMHDMTGREAVSCAISDQQPKGLVLQSDKVTPSMTRSSQPELSWSYFTLPLDGRVDLYNTVPLSASPWCLDGNLINVATFNFQYQEITKTHVDRGQEYLFFFLNNRHYGCFL